MLPDTIHLSDSATGKIHIIGGKQCRGLWRTISETKTNTRNKYCVTSFIKPNATTGEILTHCKSSRFLQGDHIILSVGEHDSDPRDVTSELYEALKALRRYHDIVIGWGI